MILSALLSEQVGSCNHVVIARRKQSWQPHPALPGSKAGSLPVLRAASHLRGKDTLRHV